MGSTLALLIVDAAQSEPSEGIFVNILKSGVLQFWLVTGGGTTFMAESDIIRFHLAGEAIILKLSQLKMTWPPPEKFMLDLGLGMPVPLVRIGMSQLTDEQIADCDHLCRGAEYEVDHGNSPEVPSNRW